MYTYPITPEGEVIYKLSLIKEIFQQIKFIGKGINPLPDWLRVQITEKPRLMNRKKAWYNDIYDCLDDAQVHSLKIVNENLSVEVEKTAKVRLESAS